MGLKLGGLHQLPKRTMAAETIHEVSLKEVANPTAARTAAIEVKVIGTHTLAYEYQIKGKTEQGRKLYLLLITKDPSQYCTGVARMQRGKQQEFTDLEKKYQLNTFC